MICIASGNAHCPDGSDWASAVMWIFLIGAIAAYKGWTAWLEHKRVLHEVEREK